MNNLIDVVIAAALLFSFGKTDGLQNVTVQVGSTAYLHCPVIHLGEREVLTILMPNPFAYQTKYILAQCNQAVKL